MAIKIQHSIRTLRLKVKTEGYAWLNEAAIEVNDVWNFANATSYKAARPFAGPSKWLSAYDLDKLTAGATKHFERIGADTIQRINAEFATRRKQFKKAKLRWRPSRGSRRALGWLPFKASQLERKGKCLRFSGKAFRVFERELLENARWKCGCFAEDSVGDWWLCLPVDHAVAQVLAPKAEQRIAQAQRRGHKRQAKRLHRTAARRRKNALHKFSRTIVNEYQRIVVGDVSSLKLAKTRMAKSVLDAGWGLLKTYLQYKGQQAGRHVLIVSERNTTRECSNCKALTGPSGLDMLVVRTWVCRECGVTHDRDVNSARNIRSAGRRPPSVSGNESPPSVAEPSQTYNRCEAGISAIKAAA
jgi:IS605 OrfB family transposase